jgi:hypothetical protein
VVTNARWKFSNTKVLKVIDRSIYSVPQILSNIFVARDSSIQSCASQLINEFVIKVVYILLVA